METVIVKAQLAAGGESMKKLPSKAQLRAPVETDEILPDYDFSKAGRNPFASQYAQGSSVVVLEPDVAAVFPASGEANDALRALAAIIRKHPLRRSVSRRSS